MPVSIDTYLRTLSYSYYLKKDSKELSQINSSISNLKTNLDRDLGALINRRFVFGSFDRDTILPRAIDQKSDVDLMVVFNHTEYERSPETYRNWLLNFAKKHYEDRYSSPVVRSSPTVTIRLGHIHYDLVPAKEEAPYPWATKRLYIPGDYGWQPTDPTDIKTSLTTANTKYNQIVRPIIRLLKAWNCSNAYSWDSYKLELYAIELNYYGDNVQTGFFYAIGQMSLDFNSAQWKRDRVGSAKCNISKVKEKLETGNLLEAKRWLHKILPTP